VRRWVPLPGICIWTVLDYNDSMKERYSPNNHAGIWFLRQAIIISLLALAGWGVFAAGLSGIAQVASFIGLATAVVYLSMKTVTDIFVSGFCQFAKAVGSGLGYLAACVRRA
jgi:hypothetical protein